MPVDLALIQQMAERVAVSEGLTLIDVEVKGGRTNQLLRIYIDKPQGVSHSDCQAVSEQMSALLDVEDPFPGSYTLEVSSPGLDRKLSKPREYEYFAGRRARLVLHDPGVERGTVLEGRLVGFHDGQVWLDLGEGERREIPLVNISKARLVPE